MPETLQLMQGYVTVTQYFPALARTRGKDPYYMEQTETIELAERLRLLVNEILTRFNQENITPREAGLVILGLTHRLMTVMDDAPEQRRYFILDFINMVNQYLAGDLRTD